MHHRLPFRGALLATAALIAAAPLHGQAESGATARYLYNGEPQAFVAQLPETLRRQPKLLAIVNAMASSYPKEFQGLEIGANQQIHFQIADAKFLYDDGRDKTAEQRLDQPDLEDQFHDLYPLTNPTEHLPKDFDPGRYRLEALALAMYGDTADKVAKNCIKVDFCGHPVLFNARCGAAAALARVAAELKPLLADNPALRIYTDSLGGTLAWRKIAGTERLSNHSFGTAIDLNVAKSDYWRWQSPASLATFSRKHWPTPIIEAFERHGFIWGGKWWHYDTMHFEYRPEIIAYAKAQQ